jgi:Double zinc ribbon
MKCPRCQHENRSGAKFCEECATPLARTCSNCGSQLSATAKFCPECAHPVAGTTSAAGRFASPQSYTPKHLAEKILTSKSALEGERKQVTVLFADLKGSMELLADRDPEEAPAGSRRLLPPPRSGRSSAQPQSAACSDSGPRAQHAPPRRLRPHATETDLTLGMRLVRRVGLGS